MKDRRAQLHGRAVPERIRLIVDDLSAESTRAERFPAVFEGRRHPARLSHQGFQPGRLFAGLEWQNGVMIIAVLIVQEFASFDDVQVPAVFP